MFTGKLTSSPFPPEQITKGKAFLEAWCKPGTKQPGDVDQEINIRLLQSFLSIAEDPDAPALDCYAEGMFLGHNRRMPRTPAVFEEKKKWRLGYVPPEDHSVEWVKNYSTAEENLKAVKTKIKEDLLEKRMVLMSYGQAKALYGDRLHIGALGMVDEGGDKYRLIHDGTHLILVNNRIRPRELVSSPIIQDIATEMSEIQDTVSSHIALVWDFKSAHRIVAVNKADWGLQACSLEIGSKTAPEVTGEVLLNTVGTFGISSAGYWWGRIAAAILRGIHYIAGPSRKACILLYADDGKLCVPLSMFRQLLPILLAFFAVLDIPVKWEKVRGGFAFQWIGYWNCLQKFEVGISEGRRKWVIAWLKKILLGEPPIADFDSGAGRLSFAAPWSTTSPS